MSNPDTIAAIATAPGRGGIGVVRVSGPACRQIAQGLLDGFCPAPRHATYRPFLDAAGAAIDCGIALYYPAPHSYTGEDVLELQAHGGPALMQLLLARCLELGARQAAAGEFTRRAFLNDKLDLAQAEAVADVIEAATVEAARSAVRSLSGEFSHRIRVLRDRLIALRIRIEAGLDFPEEETGALQPAQIAAEVESIAEALREVGVSARQGQLLREGIQAVLVGQPNVGKSSLMNRLAGEEVAIVTPMAGTTRDTIKSAIQIEGVPLHLVDTAGLRETADEIEQQGIARTWRAVEDAHVALLLVDAAHGIGAAEQAILARLRADLPCIWVHNKIDLAGKPPLHEMREGTVHLHLSAKTGAGLEFLREELLRFAGWQSGGEGVCTARARHLAAIQAATTHVQQAAGLLERQELLAEELRLAQEALNTITGEFTSDDLLGEIFSRFCIGK